MESSHESVPVGPPPTNGDSAEPESWELAGRFRVIFNLADGEWVEIGSFGSEEAAETCAQEAAIGLAAGGSWPRVGNRYLRPDTILSIEISERRQLTGSASRASYWKGMPEPEG